MNVPAVSSHVKDLYISSKNSTSFFLRVSKNDVVFVEVLPFLTPSQRDAGFLSSWFSELYLQELVLLLRSHLGDYLHKYKNVNTEDSKPSKGQTNNFILSGGQLRAACNIKRSTETNYYLMPLTKKMALNSSESNDNKFQEVSVLCEKLMIYVCPKSNSSALHLKQLLTPQKDDCQENNEDISRYFQSVSAKLFLDFCFFLISLQKESLFCFVL